LISVVVVNYNAGALLAECVASVLSSTVPVKVVVSDNGSIDDSIELLRRQLGDRTNLTIIENQANLGFSRANNVALPYVEGEYLLLLNPDCIVEPDTLEKMASFMDSHADAGMSGCLIRNLDGSEQVGCRRFVPTPWRSLVRVLKLNKLFGDHSRFQDFNLRGKPLPAAPVAVEAISGAFMFVRRSVLATVGSLDDEYFLHCEDLDWCMRFRQAKYNIYFVPDVAITHVKGGSSAVRPCFVEWHKHKGMIRFYRKFFRHQYPAALMAAVFVLVWARFVAKVSHIQLKRVLSKL
jgi:GT2 family glycosyltransferase